MADAIGTNQTDRILGAQGDDVIQGLEGDDRIDARFEKNVVDGGGGDDCIVSRRDTIKSTSAAIVFATYSPIRT